nr:hypothetical protein [Nocardioides sp. MAH-18]
MRLPRRGTVSLTGLTLALASVATGCAEPVDGPSLVLSLASPDAATEPNGPAINQFVREVERRSGGTMRIEVAWDVTPEGVEDWDQVIAEGVARGDYDLGLVPSRAWDVLGVTSLQALNTPFLIDSDEAMRAVVASDLRPDLLAGLEVAGVTGIDLWPSEMRRFFGLGAPLLSPAEFRGVDIRSPTSRTVSGLLDALGANVVQTARGASGQRGLESSFAIAGVGAVATGNVVPFAKLETLVADDALRSRLQPGQWRVLVESAAATRREQLESFPTDEESARSFCRKGDEIVAATPGDVSAFEKVGQRVRSELERDPATARLIAAIEDVVATVPTATAITKCPDRGSEPAVAGDDVRALDGIYVARVHRRDLLEAGVTDRGQLRDNTGLFTWTLDAGSWQYQQAADHYRSTDEQYGQYAYEAGRLTLYWGSEEVITARLTIDRDGTIHFSDLHDNLPELQKATEGFFGQPWRRIADLPD